VPAQELLPHLARHENCVPYFTLSSIQPASTAVPTWSALEGWPAKVTRHGSELWSIWMVAPAHAEEVKGKHMKQLAGRACGFPRCKAAVWQLAGVLPKQQPQQHFQAHAAPRQKQEQEQQAAPAAHP